MTSSFDLNVGIAIFVAIFALYIAAETQRVRARSLRQWLLPLFFPSKRDEYTATGWAFVLSRRIVLGFGFAWPLIAFLRHSPGR